MWMKERSYTMNWEAFHHRGDVLHAVITEVDNRRDGILPMDLPGVDETFRDELDLLSALALRWHTRLAGRFERELFLEPMELEDSVIATWRGTVEELPGIRAVLDNYKANPVDEAMATALAKSSAKERQLLAVWAGRVSAMEVDEFGGRIGAEIEARAREGFNFPGPRPAEPVNHTFLERVKAALVA
jgi:hypothetical protein